MAIVGDIYKVVISSDDGAVDRILRFSLDTPLYTVMNTWQRDVGAFGHYVFKSNGDGVEYDIDFTLRDVGVSVEGTSIVVLFAVLSEEPTPMSIRNVLVVKNGRYRQYSVRPYYRIRDIIPNNQGLCFYHNGKLLSRKKTFRQLGIPNNGVITVSKEIAIEVSDTSRGNIHVQEGSVTNCLKNQVKQFEKEDFFLTSNNAILSSFHSSDFKGLLKVSRSTISVTVRDQNYQWMIKGGKMEFEDLTGQLADISKISRMELTRMVYTCSGCGRRIQCQEGKSQLLNIECCTSRSLILKAEDIPAGKDVEPDDVLLNLQRKYLNLLSESKLLKKENAALLSKLSTLRSESILMENNIKNLQKTIGRLQTEKARVIQEKAEADEEIESYSDRERFALMSSQGCPECKKLNFLQDSGTLYSECARCHANFCAFCNKTFYSKKNPCEQCPDTRRDMLHAHHPRNCHYYMRDESVEWLMELIIMNNIDWKSEVEGYKAENGKCPIIIKDRYDKKEFMCAQDTYEDQQICLRHLIKKLTIIIFDKHLDPVDRMTKDELNRFSIRNHVDMPSRLSIEGLRRHFKTKLPLINEL